MSTLPPPSTGPVGWYPSPDGGDAWYFDGVRWAGSRRLMPTLPVHIGVVALVVLAVSLSSGETIAEWAADAGFSGEALLAVAALVGYAPALVWLALGRRGRTWADLGWMFRWVDIGWGSVAGVAALAVEVGLSLVVLISGVPTYSNTEGLGEIDFSSTEWIMLIIVTVVIAPCAEELIFRGALLRSLCSVMPGWVAVSVQGVIFGLAHFDPAQGVDNLGLVLVLSGVGCVLGAAALWFRRIGPSIVAHALFNGLAMAIVYSGLAEGAG